MIACFNLSAMHTAIKETAFKFDLMHLYVLLRSADRDVKFAMYPLENLISLTVISQNMFLKLELCTRLHLVTVA